MRVAFLYDENAYGTHRPAFDFADIEAGSLTGSDLAFARHAAELQKRGAEVVAYVPRVRARVAPEGFQVRNIDHLAQDLALETFGAAVSLGSPAPLALFPEATLRIVNRQCGRFGADTPKDWQSFTDLVTCPSDGAAAEVRRGLKVPVVVVPNGCDPDSYTHGPRVPGRVVHTSCPDRGLQWLLQDWPRIKRACPEANLRIFYYALESYLAEWTEPGRTGETSRRAHYIKHALAKLAPLGVEAVGGVSHRALARELGEAMVFAYPCDPTIYTETFSVATLEACAAGVVPVVVGADALGDLYRTAFPVVPAPARENLDLFTRRVIRGLTDPESRAKVIAQARAFASEYTWAKAAERLEGVLLTHPKLTAHASAEGHRVSRALGIERTLGVAAAINEQLDVLRDAGDFTWTAAEPAVGKYAAFALGDAQSPAIAAAKIPDGDVGASRDDAAVRAGTRPQEPAPVHVSADPPPRGPSSDIRELRPKARRRTIHLVLSEYSSGNVEIDLDDPYYEKEGGGCRAGFLGLVRAMAKRDGWTVRAFSTFKQQGKRPDGIEYRSVRQSTLTAGSPDVVLSYYDCAPLVGVTGCLRVASHHTFQLGGWAGALEWADVNVAPCQYVVDALRTVYDTTGDWGVMPNACIEPERVCAPVSGRVLFHTSAGRGLQHLIRAWPAIRRAAPHATLHVVGEALSWAAKLRGRSGRSAENATAIFDALPAANAAGGVTFTGFVSRKELLRELSEAEVFAFPAETVAPSETFSISILECLKMGVGVVLAPCDALASVWGGPEKPVLMTPAPVSRHLETFTGAVVKMLLDDELRDWQVRRGKAFAAKFTFEREAEALDGILRRKIGDAEADERPRATNGASEVQRYVADAIG